MSTSDRPTEETLARFLHGRWKAGAHEGVEVFDP
jgi:hypothetical protein